MGCYKEYFKPVIKDMLQEIKQVGAARAMAVAVTIVAGLKDRIEDGEITYEEITSFRKMSKEQARTLASDLLADGLGITTGAGEMLVTAAYKALQKGATPTELGIVSTEDEADLEAHLG
jgi:hypothetical protein